ncbi:MAG: M28 family peptidase, partial [Stenotrophomonas acidaminiphila]
ELLDQLKDVAKGWDIRYTPDPKPEAGLFFRSDHFPFAKRGVPALSYSAGQDWIDGGVAAGKKASDDYTARRYHQQGDEWQPDWTFAGAARDLEVVYTLGEQLANSRAWPNWSAGEPFRAVRDASADERR